MIPNISAMKIVLIPYWVENNNKKKSLCMFSMDATMIGLIT